MKIVQVIPGIKRMKHLITSYINGVWGEYFRTSEPVERDLGAYIEDWGELLMKKYDQRSRTRFLGKYGGLSLYDIYMENIYSIDDK